MYVIVVGDLWNGHSIVGPFSSEYQATDWANSHGYHDDTVWTVLPVVHPCNA